MTKSITTLEGSPSSKARRSSEDIQGVIADFEKSGMSAKSFCRLHQIRRTYFERWLLRYGGKRPAKGFVPVSTPESSPVKQPGGLFAEYRGIKIYQKVDPSYLKSLLS